MNITNLKEKLERVNQLISLKATGNPKEFAKKLNTTERTIYRLINELKEIGCPICFCKTRRSYIYKYKGKLEIKFKDEVADKESLEELHKGGGEKIIDTDNTCQWHKIALYR